MAHKARELQSDPRRAQPKPPERKGRVRLDALLMQQRDAYRAARARGEHVRVWIETED